MAKAGIAIDSWKLPIFKKHLEDAGYTFTQGLGVGDNTLILTVETSSPVALGEVVRRADNEARRSRAH